MSTKVGMPGSRRSSAQEAFLGRAVNDMAAAFSGLLVSLGHRLGLYRALARLGPATAAELAEATRTHPRLVEEWLRNQVVGGYVMRAETGGRYFMTAEQAMCLADPEGPAFLPPAYETIASAWLDQERIEGAFLGRAPLPWHERHPRLFAGVEAFFRSSYRAHLVSSWIPALDGVEARLRAGARVADVGCGHGASTVLMARAYPESSFVGFDYHVGSVETARRRAREAGVSDRVRFEVASAADYPGRDYDLICFMDCLHDLGDPRGAARHARAAAAPEGTVMLVEPAAEERPEENEGPVSRLYYAASTAVCVPHSLSQEGAALGAQAGPAALAAILEEAGFTRVRTAAATPFNLVMEARA